MENQEAKNKILDDYNGTAAQLNSLIEYAADSVVSKTILDNRPAQLRCSHLIRDRDSASIPLHTMRLFRF